MIISTKEDLIAIAGTPWHELFMTSLRGTLFSIHKKNDKWVADENNAVIERFGLTRGDFDPIEQPVLPIAETDEEITARNQAIINKESRAYLNYTDWYVIRELETGIAIPIHIARARSDSRKKIV